MKILGLDGLESLRVNFRTTKCTIMNRAMFSFMECIYLFFGRYMWYWKSLINEFTVFGINGMKSIRNKQSEEFSI